MELDEGVWPQCCVVTKFVTIVITCKPFRLVYLIVVALDFGAPSPQTFEFGKFVVFIKLDSQVMFNH
jgi:hypothetical protein